MSSTPSIPNFTLSNGVLMPALGLGTYRLRGEICQQAIQDAIREGYRLIDTAAVYKVFPVKKNEEDVGLAVTELIESGEVKREDIFITTKISPKDQGFDKAYAAAIESLGKLGPTVQCLSSHSLSVLHTKSGPVKADIDLLLIHWPGTQGRKAHDERNALNRHGSWRALEQLHREKKVRAIGVSNFNVSHLERLIDEGHADIVPHVNQFELHPLSYPLQSGLLSFCEKKHIQCQAYSSFGEGRLVDGTLDLPVLPGIASRHSCTVAQILLTWAVQHGIGVIPKAQARIRLKENVRSLEFELSPEDLSLIDRCTDVAEARKFCWDPDKVL